MNDLLVSGKPFLAIARTFGVSRDALRNHRCRHLPGELLRSQRTGELARADRLGEWLRRLVKSAAAILAHAEHEAPAGPWQKRVAFSRVALEAVRELRELAALLEKVSEDSERAAIEADLRTSPAFLELRQVVLKVGTHDAGAREQLADALRRLAPSGGNPSGNGG